MTLPSHADVVARLDAEIATYQAVKTRIATLSLIDVFVVTRQVFPDAAFIAVDNTDQDDSGSLVASEEDVLDANGDILDTDNNVVLTWVDYVWGPLSNLDSSTQVIWQPFIVQDDNGWNMRLDLNAIEQAVPGLLSSLEG